MCQYLRLRGRFPWWGAHRPLHPAATTPFSVIGCALSRLFVRVRFRCASGFFFLQGWFGYRNSWPCKTRPFFIGMSVSVCLSQFIFFCFLSLSLSFCLSLSLSGTGEPQPFSGLWCPLCFHLGCALRPRPVRPRPHLHQVFPPASVFSFLV